MENKKTKPILCISALRKGVETYLTLFIGDSYNYDYIWFEETNAYLENWAGDQYLSEGSYNLITGRVYRDKTNKLFSKITDDEIKFECERAIGALIKLGRIYEARCKNMEKEEE